LNAHFAEMVERGIGGDAAEPGLEVAVGPEAGVRAISAQESFHGQILGRSGIADDADGPAIDGGLVLAKERFKSVEAPRREPLEQVHVLPSILITGFWQYWLHELGGISTRFEHCRFSVGELS